MYNGHVAIPTVLTDPATYMYPNPWPRVEIPCAQEFGLLTALTDLDISLNSLEKIDGLQWVNLTRMKRLNLRGNAPLEVLPFQLGMYDDLAWLDVTGCNINSPPPVIIQRGVRPIIDYLRRLYDGQV